MKKIMVFTLLAFLSFSYSFLNQLNADTLSYPFDSITIVEAYTFDVTIPSTITSDSLLFGQVTEGEVISIYVGTLEFVLDGVPASGSSQVIIVSDSEGNDLFQFLINNYLYQEGILQSYGFASHILIDPEVGVFKDLSLLDAGLQEFVVVHDLINDAWSFSDDEGTEMLAMPGTYASETGLSIVISAYSGTGE